MGELEDKLNSILSSPQEMEKIMGIARSLSEGAGDSNSAQKEAEAPTGADFSGIDLKMLSSIGRLMGEFSRSSDEKAGILKSIQPFLKKERREKLSRASELARMAKIARTAFSEFPGGDRSV